MDSSLVSYTRVLYLPARTSLHIVGIATVTTSIVQIAYENYCTIFCSLPLLVFHYNVGLCGLHSNKERKVRCEVVVPLRKESSKGN